MSDNILAKKKKKKNSKIILIIIGAVILIGGVGLGVYFSTREKPSKPTEKPSRNPTPPTPIKYTCPQCNKEYNTKDSPLVDGKYCSQSCRNDAKREQEDREDKEKKVRIAKSRMLDVHKIYFTEQELSTLLSKIPYQGIDYSTATLEEFVNNLWETIKKKADKPFAKFPANTQEFKEGYQKAEKRKTWFYYATIIPRQADGKVDWVKWEKQNDKITEKNKSFKKEEIKKYLEDKVNPAFKTWLDNFKDEPDPVKRLEMLNQQILEHINIQMTGFYLIKIARENGLVGQDVDIVKDSLLPNYNDASDNEIEIDFPLTTEYDLSAF